MSNEADTCRTYILPKLKAAGWEDDAIAEQLVLAPGQIIPSIRYGGGVLRVVAIRAG